MTRTQMSSPLLSSKLFMSFSAAATTSSVAPVSLLGGPLFVDVNPSLPPGAEKSQESNLHRVLAEIKPSLLACAVGKFGKTGLGIF